jgi:hypothetical protein
VRWDKIGDDLNACHLLFLIFHRIVLVTPISTDFRQEENFLRPQLGAVYPRADVACSLFFFIAVVCTFPLSSPCGTYFWTNLLWLRSGLFALWRHSLQGLPSSPVAPLYALHTIRLLSFQKLMESPPSHTFSVTVTVWLAVYRYKPLEAND